MVDCDFFGMKNPEFESKRSTKYGCDGCLDRVPCYNKWLKNALKALEIMFNRPRRRVRFKLCGDQ